MQFREGQYRYGILNGWGAPFLKSARSKTPAEIICEVKTWRRHPSLRRHRARTPAAGGASRWGATIR